MEGLTMATLTIEGAARQGHQMTRAEVAEIHRLQVATDAPVAVIAGLVGRCESSVRRALGTRLMDWPVSPARRPPPSPTASLDTRRARARVRGDLTSGRVRLQDVLVPPHPAVADVALVDIVRMQWRHAGGRATPALEQLGKFAVRDGVNLMMAAGRASAYSRAWVAEHGSKWARPRVVASIHDRYAPPESAPESAP